MKNLLNIKPLAEFIGINIVPMFLWGVMIACVAIIAAILARGFGIL